MTPDAYVNAFQFVETLRDCGAVVSLEDDGQVCCDVCRVEFEEGGEAVVRFVFHQMHDAIAAVLRDERQTGAAH